MDKNFDSLMMLRCLELAQKAAGRTSPNPLVGSVIVQNGKIIAEGYHTQAGSPHAEIEAIRSTCETTEGATLYVNLEPCNHYGRTPPCTEAIIQAGISRVVVGMVDPDERVSGGGIDRLKVAGIQVDVGTEEISARRLNEGFIYRSLHQQPFGIYKYAMTLDGKIATNIGNSNWVTASAARRYVHLLRSTVDAVIVGGNTVCVDNPYLTTHNLTLHNPLRIVISRSLNLPKKANLWNQEEAKTLIFTQPNCNYDILAHLKSLGLEVIQIDQLTPKKVMNVLYEKGLSKVLWEAGSRLSTAAVLDGCVQKILAFIAPKIIGGKKAPTPLEDLGLNLMKDAIELENISFTALEPDFLVEGYLNLRLK